MMSPNAEPEPAPRPPGLRGWPAVLILAGLAVWIFATWLREDLARQRRVMGTGAGILVAVVLLGIWWLFLSRLRWRLRWMGIGLAVAGLVLVGVLFRFHGVTGDLVPILEPRWSARATPTAAASPTPTSASASAAGRTSGSTAGLAAATKVASFPQFLGPTRDGVVPGIRLARDWRARAPEALWRQSVGEGWGGFAIAGDRALTQEQDGPKERVVCYDLLGGGRVWAHGVEARYDNPLGGIGPRATPTVVGDRVYALGATGHLACLDLATGRVWWSIHVLGAEAPKDLEWGVSSSPLVVGGVVVIAPHGVKDRALAAYQIGTGALAWLGVGMSAHYSSPRLETLLGVPQVLTFGSSVAAYDPATGRELWRHPWRGGHPHVTDPRGVGTNRVLVSSGYGTGSQLLELERAADGVWKTPTTVWRSMRLKSKFANLLVREEFAYGLDDGRLVCLDLGDGTSRWQGDRYGHGQLLLVGDVILLTAENGDVVLVEASPAAFRELTRFRAVDGKTWNPPALAGDVLIVRNDREAAAYRLPTEP